MASAGHGGAFCGVRGGLPAGAVRPSQHRRGPGSRPSTPIPAGPGGPPRRAAGRRHHRGASQVSSQLAPAVQPFLPGCSKCSPPQPSGSYRDALLGGAEMAASTVGKAKLVVAAPKQSQSKDCRQSKTFLLRAPLPPSVDTVEGWQVVGPRRRRAQRRMSSSPPKAPSPRYLAAVAGRCLNCLSPSHRVATCRLPTRCFNCHGLRHHLRNCKRPRTSSTRQASDGCAARANAAGEHVDQAKCDVSSNLCRQGGSLKATMANFESRDPGQTWTQAKDSECLSPEVLEAMLHLDREPLGTSLLRSWDPMIEEAAMGEGCSTCRAGGVTVMAKQLVKETLEVYAGSSSSTPSPPAPSPCVANHNLSVENLQTPVTFRSEAEQLIGHELIKALSNFKKLMVAPSSPSIRQNTPLEKEADMLQLEGNQSCNQPRKSITKSRKSNFKVVRDILTKKWIFVKEVKQLGNWTLQRFLDTCKKPTSASRFETIRHLSEMAMLRKAVRRLTKAAEKMKKKKLTIH